METRKIAVRFTVLGLCVGILCACGVKKAPDKADLEATVNARVEATLHPQMPTEIVLPVGKSTPAPAPKPAEIAQPTLEVNPDAILALRDATGVQMNFNTVRMEIFGEPYPDIFADEQLIGIEQQGLTLLFPIEMVSDYQQDGAAASVVLTNGESIKGSPLSFSITGETALGEVSISGEDIRTLKFNLNQARKIFESPDYQKNKYYYGKNGLTGTVALNSGATLPLKQLQAVERYHGCDTMWIPCKDYSGYRLNDGINIKVGGFESTLELSRTQSINLSSYATPMPVNMKLLSGETIDATRNEENNVWKGIVGTDDRGYLYYIPIEAIHSVTDVRPTSPQSLLIGKWQQNGKQQVIEITDEFFIFYDVPSTNNKQYLKYDFVDDHTIKLDVPDTVPFEFKVDQYTFTIIGADGTVTTFSRISPP
jgi:hypothetical protein